MVVGESNQTCNAWSVGPNDVIVECVATLKPGTIEDTKSTTSRNGRKAYDLWFNLVRYGELQNVHMAGTVNIQRNVGPPATRQFSPA